MTLGTARKVATGLERSRRVLRRASPIRAIALASIIAFAAPAIAQGCSGGSDGGMDATGNQCNDPAAQAAAHPPEVTSPATVATALAGRIAQVPATSARTARAMRTARIDPRETRK